MTSGGCPTTERKLSHVVMDIPASQASSHFTLEPVSCDILAENEVRRRNEARALGLVKSGCVELDEYVFVGGLERGCVVGMSSEEEGVGLSVSCSL